MNRSHPVLKESAKRPRVKYNTLWDEMEAAKEFGWEAYWGAGKEERIAMVGFLRAQGLIKAICNWEAMPDKAKRQWG